MFSVEFQVHGAADTRTLVFNNEKVAYDWVAKNQEEFSFVRVFIKFLL